MVKIGDAPRKRVGDFNPDVETGETLDPIEGMEVDIASVEYDERTGRKGPYTLAIIHLTDGRIFHTGGAVVVERLRAVEDFPVLATFEKVKSESNPGQKYWTVS